MNVRFSLSLYLLAISLVATGCKVKTVDDDVFGDTTDTVPDTEPDTRLEPDKDLTPIDLSWMVCCVEDEKVYFSTVKDQCVGDGLTETPDSKWCELVCCSVDANYKTIAAGTCNAAGGEEVAANLCTPAPTQCTTDTDFDDKNPCTYESCVNSYCQYKPQSGTACDDGDECTSGDQCDMGFCQSSDVDPECGGKICCDIGGGYGLMTEDDCKATQGTTHPADKCAEVCCKQDGNLTKSVKLDCEKNGAIQDAAECELVCCETKELQYAFLKWGECEVKEVPEKCEDSEVCCEGDEEPAVVPAKDCPDFELLPPGDCGDICCVQGETATDMSAEECENTGGKIYDNMLCDNVCCEINGSTYLAAAAVCHNGGEEKPVEDCDLVCCAWDDGQFFKQTKVDCVDNVVEDSKCEGNEVCCDLGDGPLKVDSAQCLSPKGTPQHPESCGDICCLYEEDGVTMTETTSGETCNETYEGAGYVVELCEKVCCHDAQKYYEASEAACNKTGNKTEAQYCEEVCCVDGQNVDQTEKGNCNAEIQPADQCEIVCCLEGDPHPAPKGLCGQVGAWADCPGSCGTSADCGTDKCSDDKTKSIAWNCVNWTCQQVEIVCPQGQQCHEGSCQEGVKYLKIGGSCMSDSISYEPFDGSQPPAWVVATIVHNSITCCANTGCGGYNHAVGPTPCGFPIEMWSANQSDTVTVDVSGWDANVGASYLFIVEPPYYSIGGAYTDTWCNDNWPVEPWNETYPGYTEFVVAPLQEVCCELDTGKYGLLKPGDCQNPVDPYVCLGMDICCAVGDQPELMKPFDCFKAGGQPKDADDCEDVCCFNWANDTGEVMNSAMCVIQGDAPLLPDMCNKGCCKTADGYNKKSLAACLGDKGYLVSDDICEEICCYLGAYQNEKIVKGKCQEKGWNVYDDVSECDMVCCFVWGDYEVRAKYNCGMNDVSTWDNCPGKCNAPADCGPPVCDEELPASYDFYECIDNGCNQVSLDCPDAQMCYDGKCE
jgi:hypothetical protein